MTDLRIDPLTGRPVVVVGPRQDRPNLPADGCPFCPGGLEAPEPYTVRWFPNRWPPLPDARAEVLLYSPDHDGSMATLGREGATAVVELWADRTRDLGCRDDVAYVLIFENRGPEVGATIAHPHGQLYAFNAVPPEPAAELAGTTCRLCALIDPAPSDRRVASAEGWTAMVPPAPSWPYELLLLPDAHIPDLPAVVDRGGAAAMAGILGATLGRLDALFDAPMPYMLWVHQRPTDGEAWPGAHVHVHVAPLYRSPGTPRFVAAGELGSGVHFNPVTPADAAAQLRAARP